MEKEQPEQEEEKKKKSSSYLSEGLDPKEDDMEGHQPCHGQCNHQVLQRVSKTVGGINLPQNLVPKQMDRSQVSNIICHVFQQHFWQVTHMECESTKSCAFGTMLPSKKILIQSHSHSPKLFFFKHLFFKLPFTLLKVPIRNGQCLIIIDIIVHIHVHHLLLPNSRYH